MHQPTVTTSVCLPWWALGQASMSWTREAVAPCTTLLLLTLMESKHHSVVYWFIVEQQRILSVTKRLLFEKKKKVSSRLSSSGVWNTCWGTTLIQQWETNRASALCITPQLTDAHSAWSWCVKLSWLSDNKLQGPNTWKNYANEIFICEKALEL